jgi:putative methionine-R-sulfoxide reductase with GAF domain
VSEIETTQPPNAGTQPPNMRTQPLYTGEKPPDTGIKSLPQELPDQEARRRDQYLDFARWVQRATLPAAVLLFGAAYTTNTPQLYIWGTIPLAMFLSSAISSWATRAGQLNFGVYFFAGTILSAMLVLPLFVSNLLVLVFLANIIAILLVGLFVSPRMILWMTGIAFVLSLLAIMLETWAPLSPPRATSLAGSFSLTALAFIGGLLYLFGDSMTNLLRASQGYAVQLEQSQSDLLARTQELESTAADLASQSQALQTASRQIEETARQSQRRAQVLQAIIEVSRSITQMHDPDQLLHQITQLISQYFGFYHVGVFMLDETNRYAVLRAANSPGGQRMLARRHRLAVGTEGIVGHAVSTNRPRIALDVGADAAYFDNPDLPDTRSEIALPLHSGSTVIGVLDVQSIQESAFDEQDIQVLTALSDQVSIAIENARLFQESQAALAQAEDAYRQYVRQEWDRFLRPGHKQAAPAMRLSTPGPARTGKK